MDIGMANMMVYLTINIVIAKKAGIANQWGQHKAANSKAIMIDG